MAVEYFKNQGTALDRAQARIADIDFAIVSVDPSLKVQIQGAAKNFLIHGTPPHIIIEARWDDLSEMELRGQKVFESGAVWQLYQNDNIYIFSLSSPALGSTPYKIARVRKDFSQGEVLLHRGYFDQARPIYPLEYPLDELLFIHYLALGRGAEVHACGVVDAHGDGHLFLGQSGAGKTTLAKLWQNEKKTIVLSDDRIILRKMGEELWMYGTPWHGEAGIASPLHAKLSRLYFLEHGKKNKLVELGTTEAMAKLFACSFVPFYSPEALKFTAGFFEEVAKAVPCCRLSFFPDKRVISFVQQLRDTTPQPSLFIQKPSPRTSAFSSQRLFIELSTDLLRQGQSVRFKAPGRSMQPTINEGETITIQPAAPSAMSKGDIILYSFERGFIAHRVLRIMRRKGDAFSFIMRGDASDAFDCPVSAQQVLGKVISVERRGRSIDLYSRKARIQHIAHKWASLLKKLILRTLKVNLGTGLTFGDLQ